MSRIRIMKPLKCLIKHLSLITLVSLASNVTLASENDDWDNDWGDDTWEEEKSYSLSGFVEVFTSERTQSNTSFDGNTVVREVSNQINFDWNNDSWRLKIKGDLFYEDHENDLGTRLRAASLSTRLNEKWDLKLGRQMLTWGLGDLLFINDVFPKDWKSFFSGRDDEYLKKPVDGVRLSRYGAINADLVWAWEPQLDNAITGDVFSFFNPAMGEGMGLRYPMPQAKPKNSVDNGEWYGRLFKSYRKIEYALYGFDGWSKSPAAVNDRGIPTYHKINVFGGSLRSPMLTGIGYLEVGYTNTADDKGDNPQIPNNHWSLLLGFEKEWVTRLNISFQWLTERIDKHQALIENSLFPQFEREQLRTVLTQRIEYRSEQERWRYSLFTYYSPTENDYYVRPRITYRHDDNWSFIAGGNIFGGKEEHTFFAQFEENTNAYLRVRLSY